MALTGTMEDGELELEDGDGGSSDDDSVSKGRVDTLLFDDITETGDGSGVTTVGSPLPLDCGDDAMMDDGTLRYTHSLTHSLLG